MARGTKQIEGQLTFDFCMDASNYVAQANELVGGRQALKVNSAKLIRAAIMQIRFEDNVLNPYLVKISELADLLQVSKSNLYRDIDEITDDIIANPVYIRKVEGSTVKWVKIPWVSRCEYNSDIGVLIKLNDELRPYLLGLRQCYTQYALEDILTMRSIYAIRLFEILQSEIKAKILPREGVSVDLSIEFLRESCDCTDKYVRFSQFRERVLEAAKKEINKKTMYEIDYECIKNKKTVELIRFHVMVDYRKAPLIYYG